MTLFLLCDENNHIIVITIELGHKIWQMVYQDAIGDKWIFYIQQAWVRKKFIYGESRGSSNILDQKESHAIANWGSNPSGFSSNVSIGNSYKLFKDHVMLLIFSMKSDVTCLKHVMLKDLSMIIFYLKHVASLT